MPVTMSFAEQPDFVWALKVPFSVLCAFVLALCIASNFSHDLRVHDIWLILAFGIAA
jgi:putative tricarboxylic transport membrane protein